MMGTLVEARSSYVPLGGHCHVALSSNEKETPCLITQESKATP
jgi:hypothetical protein